MPINDMSEALQSTKEIQLAGKTVAVKKLSLRQIIGLSKAIQSIPAEFLNGAGEKDNAEFLQNVPELLMELLPKYSLLVSETLDKQVTAKEIENADIDELFDLVEAFLEVNNIPKIMARVGKVKALATGAKVETQEAIG